MGFHYAAVFGLAAHSAMGVMMLPKTSTESGIVGPMSLLDSQSMYNATWPMVKDSSNTSEARNTEQAMKLFATESAIDKDVERKAFVNTGEAAEAPTIEQCVTITTGSNSHDDGYLSVMVKVDGIYSSIASDRYYDHGEQVLDRCYDGEVDLVRVRNTRTNAWVGRIYFYYRINGENQGDHYMYCYSCDRNGVANEITVDGNSDSGNLADTRCYNGDYCYLRKDITLSPTASPPTPSPTQVYCTWKEFEHNEGCYGMSTIYATTYVASSSPSLNETCQDFCDNHVDDISDLILFVGRENQTHRSCRCGKCKYRRNPAISNKWFFDCIVTASTPAPATPPPTITPLPTPSPTQPPSPTPWSKPSATPWSKPSATHSPTTSSTPSPTPSPTEMPTPQPTPSPSESPTMVPTQQALTIEQCVTITTGSSSHDDGYLSVKVKVDGSYYSIASDRYYDHGERVLDRCYDGEVDLVRVRNTRTNAWVGRIYFYYRINGENQGDHYMYCYSCDRNGVANDTGLNTGTKGNGTGYRGACILVASHGRQS